MADTGFLSPTTNGTPATYDGSATEFSNASNAYADDSNYATAVDDEANYKYQSYGGFGITIPSGATVVGIELVAKGKTSAGTQTGVGFLVRYGAGATDFASGSDDSFTTTEASKTYGGPTSMWSQSAWTADQLSDANFAVIFRSSSFDSPSGRTVSLNHVKIKVYYTLPGASNIIIM